MLRFGMGSFGHASRGNINFGKDCANDGFSGKNPFSFDHGAGLKGLLKGGHSGATGKSLFGHHDDHFGGKLANLFGRHHDSHDDDKGHHHSDDHDHHHDDHHGGKGDDCDSSDSGNGSSNGVPFPDVPDDTTGVTFHIDLNGDGLDDRTIWIETPAGSDVSSMDLSDYYGKAVTELQSQQPDADPKQAVIKATIYSASQGESYYYFTGNETDDPQDDTCDDSDHDDQDGHDGHHHGDHGHGKDHHQHDHHGGKDGDDDHDGHEGHGDKDGDDDDRCEDGKGDHGGKGDESHDDDKSCEDFFKQFVAKFGCIDDRDDEDNHDDNEDEDHDSHEKACWI